MCFPRFLPWTAFLSTKHGGESGIPSLSRYRSPTGRGGLTAYYAVNYGGIFLISFCAAFPPVQIPQICSKNAKKRTKMCVFCIWRREWDLNPRYAFGVHTISNRAPSTPRTSLLVRDGYGTLPVPLLLISLTII